MTCRRRRTPSCRAPRGQRQLAMISSATQQSGAGRGLTADCFNETGKHCCSGGWLPLERRVVEWCVRDYDEPRHLRDRLCMLWGSLWAAVAVLGTIAGTPSCIVYLSLVMSRFVLSGARPLLQCSSRKMASCNAMNWSLRKLTTATAASGDASNLPLAGIKVLDMTRVLAGVRPIHL